jgi:hypothetical protein
MIEYLLANRDLSVEIENNVLALASTVRLSPEQIEPTCSGSLKSAHACRNIFSPKHESSIAHRSFSSPSSFCCRSFLWLRNTTRSSR